MKNMRNLQKYTKMKQDFFTYLPPEIMIDILTRLPIQSIMSCKCVCKSWRNLVKSPEFAESHLSISVPCIAIYRGMMHRKPYRVFEFVDELDRRMSAYCDIVFNFRFDFPYDAFIHSSVNGFLFMYDGGIMWPRNLIICNPVTRDYIMLPHPPKRQFLKHTFGFGVSKMTGQYKLVRIFRICNDFVPPKCQVYTLGTGSWRSVEAGSPLTYQGCIGAFVKGNLHWLVTDSKGHQSISCFDLETELFSTFSSPPKYLEDNYCCFSALGDRLCLCSNFKDEIIIWMMKEYGDEKSWTKEFVIKKPSHRSAWGKFIGFRFPVKVFKDGDVLVAEEDGPGLFFYSTKTRTIREIDPFQVYSHCRTSAVIYTPSFLSVKMFAMENVSSF